MAKKKSPPNKKENDFSFESSFEELQEIVDQLEGGNMTLTESLKSYELGIQRLKQCYQALNDAELKIKQLVQLDSDGNLITSQFEVESAKKPGRKSGNRKSTESESNDELF